MIVQCWIHGLVCSVFTVRDEATKEEYHFCEYCLKEHLLREMRSGKAPSTAD